MKGKKEHQYVSSRVLKVSTNEMSQRFFLLIIASVKPHTCTPITRSMCNSEMNISVNYHWTAFHGTFKGLPMADNGGGWNTSQTLEADQGVLLVDQDEG